MKKVKRSNTGNKTFSDYTAVPFHLKCRPSHCCHYRKWLIQLCIFWQGWAWTGSIFNEKLPKFYINYLGLIYMKEIRQTLAVHRYAQKPMSAIGRHSGWHSGGIYSLTSICRRAVRRNIRQVKFNPLRF